MTTPGFIPSPSKSAIDEIAKIWRVIRGMQKQKAANDGYVARLKAPATLTIPAAPASPVLCDQIQFMAQPGLRYKLSWMIYYQNNDTVVRSSQVNMAYAAGATDVTDPSAIGFGAIAKTMPIQYDSMFVTFTIPDTTLSGLYTVGTSMGWTSPASTLILGSQRELVLETF